MIIAKANLSSSMWGCCSSSWESASYGSEKAIRGMLHHWFCCSL